MPFAIVQLSSSNGCDRHRGIRPLRRWFLEEGIPGMRLSCDTITFMAGGGR